MQDEHREQSPSGSDPVLSYAERTPHELPASAYVARRILIYVAVAALLVVGYSSFDGTDVDAYCVQCGALRHTSEARWFGVTIPLQDTTQSTTLSKWIEEQQGRACTHGPFNSCDRGWKYSVCHHGNPVPRVKFLAQTAGLTEVLDQQLAADPAFVTRLQSALANQTAADHDELLRIFTAALEHAASAPASQ